MATNCTDYAFSEIEPHWQHFWETHATFRAKDFSEKPPFYALDMFPYPSGAGLHIGHPEGYTASDILGRYKLARGHNVLHPMGWDAFGLPAEQHAIATGTHPRENTRTNVDNFRGQIKRLGFGLDWEREINTTDPEYFKWTQWIFLKLFEHGLAYIDEKPVWWCPELGTVLANEEVIDGRSERGNHPVERRPLRQWVLRITAYADKLLEGLHTLDWPESTKRMQQEWIGRSEGAEVHFAIEGKEERLTVYTTRPDTLFGATYLVVAPEHPIVPDLINDTTRAEVEAYVEAARRKSEVERQSDKTKTGAFTGSYAINPVNNQKIPIWVADYVLYGYGTGAIMAVPAHDERDHAFAEAFGLDIIEVIRPDEPVKGCYTGSGTMVNCGEHDGLSSEDFKRLITEKLETAGEGNATVNYKLRDWLFSRQRYWGEPFPIVFVSEADYARLEQYPESPWRTSLPKEPVSFEQDGTRWIALALPSSQLPLELPEVESYQPSGNGESPLANATDWANPWINLATGDIAPTSENAPEGGGWARARRETNTMPQWAGSCWYYLRYLDPHNPNVLVDPEKERYWGMPDLYIGGAEHAVLHLLYARFWHLFLHDLGILSHREPFCKLFHQGIILGEDGQKMSKSRGNVVNPDDLIAAHGADALRLFEMFLGPLEAMKPWNTSGIEGIARFLRKVWRDYIGENGARNPKITNTAESDPETERLLHETIKKVGEDIENLRLNTAISQLMVMANRIQKIDTFSHANAKIFLQLLAPFAPHLAEELWERIGETPSIAHAPWPAYDALKLERSEVKIIFQVMGKLRGDALLPKDVSKDDAIAAAKAHERVSAFIEGKQIVKEIYVPGKIVNLVVR